MNKGFKNLYKKLNKCKVLNITIGGLVLNSIFPALVGIDNKFTRSIPAYAIEQSALKSGVRLEDHIDKTREDTKKILGNTNFNNFNGWRIGLRSDRGLNLIREKQKNTSYEAIYTVVKGTDKKNEDTGYRIKPNGNKSFTVKRDKYIKDESINDEYVLRINPMDKFKLEEGEEYLFQFDANAEKNTSGNGLGIDIRFTENYVNGGNDLKYIRNGDEFKKYTDHMWRIPNNNSYKITTYGEGKSVYFQIRIRGRENQIKSNLTLGNFQANNITNAATPDINKIVEHDLSLSGKAIKGSNDKRENQEGDLVHVFKVNPNGTETYIASTKLDKNNKWKVSLNNKAKYGEEFKVKIQHPRSGKIKTKTINVDYNLELHKPSINQAKEKENVVKGKGYPGDEIVIEDSDGKELGSGQVDDDGFFTVNLNRPLEEGEDIKASPDLENIDKKNRPSASVTVTYDDELHKPKVEEVLEDEDKIVGKGVPGDEIIIRDSQKNEIGRGKVDEEGNFNISLDKNPVKDEILEIIAKTGDNNGSKTEIKVGQSHKPEIKEAKEGESNVVGKGKPGDHILIEDSEGDEIGRGIVDEEGNFNIDLDRPLKQGEKISAIPDLDDLDKEERPSSTVEVTYESSKHKPELDELKEGEVEVKGTGTPGDEIIIKDSEENEIGRGKVDKEGNFNIDVNRPLIKDEEILAIPVTGNNKGDYDKTKVIYNDELHKPKLDKVIEDSEYIKGEGYPGDEIIITNSEGKEIGRGKVEEDGKFKIKVDSPLKKDDEIVAYPEGGEENDSLREEAVVKEKLVKPVLEVPSVGDKEINGYGKPGNTIVIADKGGNVLGEVEVDKDGEFKIELDSPLEEGDKIVAYPKSGEEDDSLREEVVVKEKLEKPELNTPESGDKEISGHGKPGNTIVIADKEGNVLGEVEVDKDGEFKIELDSPLEEGEEIVAYPKGGEEDDSLREEVVVKEKLEKPELNTPESGDKEINGHGKPGNTIVIADKEGNVLGEVEVGEDGEFKIELDSPLEEGDKIVAYPKDGEEDDKLKEEVVVKEKLEKPELNTPESGDKEISGHGKPGNTIVIEDKGGNVLGEVEVGEDGYFKIDLDDPLEEGEEIVAYPKGGEEDDKLKEEVVVKEKLEKPEEPGDVEGGKDPVNPEEPGDGEDEKDPVNPEEPGDGEGGKDPVNPEEPSDVEGEKDPVNPEEPSDVEGEKDPVNPEEPGDVEGEKDPVNPEEPGEVEGEKDPVNPEEPSDVEGEKDPVNPEEPGDGEGGKDPINPEEPGDGEGGKDPVNPEEPGEVEGEKDPVNPEEPGEVEGEKDPVNPEEPGDGEGEKDPVNPEEPGDGEGVITINKPLIGDEEVRGTYLPNKKIVIKDSDNNVLGEGFTNENGDYSVLINRSLMAGEHIYAYPMINDKLGKPAQDKVNDTDTPKGDSEGNSSSTGSSSGSSSSSRRKKRDKNNDTKDEEKEAVGDIFYKTENNSISDSTEYLKNHKLNTNDHFSYIKGYTDKTVRPESYITREEVAAVFYRLLDETYRNSIETKSHNFKDLDNKRWSTTHIATLANGKILRGYQDGSFKPKENITRAELTSIISGLSELNLENINRDKAETFIDISGHWAEDYIKSANKKDWVKGYQDKTFRPDRNITRAEFVTIVNNVLNRKVRKEGLLDNRKEFQDLSTDKWYYEAMQEAINSHYYERQSDGYEKWIELYDFIIEK